MSTEYTVEEVSKHNTPESLWIIIDNHVYDVTEWQHEHPGGKKILARVGGKDATKQFHKYHEVERVMQKFGVKRRIGKVKGGLSANETAAIEGETQHELFGDMVAYGDNAWYQGYHSPYYNETHVALRAEVRAWVDEHIMPYVDDWDAEGSVDPELYKKFGQKGWLPLLVGLKNFPTEYAKVLPKSVSPEKADAFHEVVIAEEVCRAGSGAVTWNLMGGFAIGIPPIFKFAQKHIRERILPSILSGEKRICLCITEPDAGSDVANLTTTAEKTPDGKHYIVNGNKKWITNGIYADYFTVAVRTGGKGMGGISMVLIEKTMPGVSVRKIETQGMRGSGSAYITFEDVKVPVENLIGKENKGFGVIMTNFNHERLGTIIQACRFARLCTESAMKYAHHRSTFGQKLIEHGVIRNKLGQMVGRVEAAHHWMEHLTYQYQTFSEQEAMLRLGGPIAACKAFTTQAMEFCASEAIQVFGGLGYTRGGKGAVVERLFRESKAYSIPGGSLEIMLDLGIRQQLRVNDKLGAKI